ncbi:helix-turn-helix transcriptional regulator [bacterium]|nr:helix-turn-helix transcriptional regulator [bacterium]
MDEKDDSASRWLEKRCLALNDQSDFCWSISGWTPSGSRFDLDYDHPWIGLDKLDTEDKLCLLDSLQNLAMRTREALDNLAKHLPIGKEPFSRNLKAIREQREMVLVGSGAEAIFVVDWQYVASRMDMTIRELWSWESGVTEPTLNQLRRLAQVLGVTADDLLNETDEEPEDDHEDEDWAEDDDADEDDDVPGRKLVKPRKPKN